MSKGRLTVDIYHDTVITPEVYSAAHDAINALIKTLSADFSNLSLVTWRGITPASETDSTTEVVTLPSV